ncbi:MAG: (d)CMP kinase [Holosporaceae bacterium]|jgi:cytidylate kinase|nr:(d)CMP kinase [Holosporaceae bacterium]
MTRKPIVAIDGPAGSGKGTIARMLADHFGFAYLDTGALYRIAAHANVNFDEITNLSVHDLLKIAADTPEDVLKSDIVGCKASDIAKLPHIREVMTQLQREFVANPGNEFGGSILDGRDIGTVVIPNADCKIFITADPEVRAKRRWNFLKITNPLLTYETIYQSIVARDEQDQSRKIAPLTCDESYVLLDTSADTIDMSLAKAVKIVRVALSE